jgi:hypothetical protein
MTHLLNPYLILVSAFLFGAGSRSGSPTHSSVIAEMVSEEELASGVPVLREELLARVPFPLGDTSPRLYRAGLAGRLILAEIADAAHDPGLESNFRKP